MPITVPAIIPAPAPAAAPIQESRAARVPRQVDDTAPSRAPRKAPRTVARAPLPAMSVQFPLPPEAVRADCSHSLSRDDSTSCVPPATGRVGAVAQPAPSSMTPNAPANRLRNLSADSMRVTSGSALVHPVPLEARVALAFARHLRPARQ